MAFWLNAPTCTNMLPFLLAPPASVGVGVARAIGVDVIDGLVKIVHHAHGDDEVEVLGRLGIVLDPLEHAAQRQRNRRLAKLAAGLGGALFGIAAVALVIVGLAVWAYHSAEEAERHREIAENALNRLPIPKRMRWGDSEAQFVRPVHWLVFLLGDQVVPCTLLDAAAGNQTFGHRNAPRGGAR